MTTTFQKNRTEACDCELPQGVVLDASGVPVESITAEEWMHKLGNMLVTHYGEPIRPMLNESLLNHGMKSLSQSI
jgi:hypothetical protein